MATLGELVVKIGANVGAFNKGMNDTTKTMNKWQKQAERSMGPVMNQIERGLKIIGTAAIAGFAAATTASVRGASSLEGYRNTLNVVMKDQEKAAKTMAWAIEFANKTPFQTNSIVEATVRLTAYGLEAQKVMPQIGDMAAVMNKDIMQAVEAVADAQTGELERLKEFGITKAMIIDQANKTMRGIEVVNQKGQIVDQENFNKALFSLMDERFKGGMEIQASSFKGLWSTVAGVFSTTLSTMAGITATGEVKIGGFFESLKNKMQLVVDKLYEWQENGKLEEWSEKAQTALTNFFNVAEKVFGFLVDTGKFIYDNWNFIMPILAGVLAGFMAFKTAEAVINGVRAAQTALNLVMGLNPIGLLVFGIAALVTAGVLLYKNWDTIKAKAQELWTKLKQTFDDIKASVGNLWVEAKQWGMNIIEGLWNGINSKAQWIKDKVTGFVSGIGSTIKDFFGISSPSTLMALYGKYIIEGLSEGINKNADKVKSAADNMSTAITQALDKIKDNLSLAASIADAKFALISARMTEGKDKSKLLTAEYEMLTTKMKIQNDIVSMVTKSYNDMVAAKGEAALESQKLYLELLKETKAQEDLQRAIQATNATQKNMSLSDMKKISDSAKNSGTKYYSNSLALAKSNPAYSKTVQALTDFGMGLTEAIERTRQRLGAAALPSFGNGGTVPGPIGSPQIIKAHGGEIVLPTHKKKMASDVTVNIYGNDPYTIGQQVVRVLREQGVT